MNPLAILGLLGGVGGLFGLSAAGDPTRRLMGQLSPANTLNSANQFYQGFLQSPAYWAAQSGILANSNALQSRLSTSLGARGLGTSGVGAIAQPLAQSVGGFQMSNLNADFWRQALMAAQQRQQLMLGLPQTNWNAQLASSLLGAAGAGLGAYYGYKSR